MRENESWGMTLVPAIIGLVGVLVGGVITTGANYWIEERKEEAEAAKDKMSRANELKTVARLVWNEFSTAHSYATFIIEDKRRKHREFHLDVWERNKEVLARELPLDVRVKITKAAIVVEKFKELTPDPDSIVSEGAVEIMKPFVKEIELGRDALRPYMIGDAEKSSFLGSSFCVRGSMLYCNPS
jgi:hypothetical protein